MSVLIFWSDGKQVYLPKFYSVATFWLIYFMNPCSAFKGFTSVFGGASIKAMDTMKPEKCTDVAEQTVQRSKKSGSSGRRVKVTAGVFN